jgi:hypothetical protein
MVGPTDAILPILQCIQADVADTKRDVDKINVTLAQHGKKLDAIEGYLTYQLGISSRTIADVEALKNEILEIKKRVEVLEHH